MINLTMKYGDELKYKKKDVLYRGVRKENITVKDYLVNNVHYWPTFTSTSRSLYKAHEFSDYLH